MLIKYLSKSLFLKTVLVLLGLAIALTLYPFAKNLNLADVQDTDSCSNILYFPTINSSRDWQTTVSITNTECKSKQRKANVTLIAYDKDGLSLGVVKNIARLRANKTKNFYAKSLPSGTKSLTVESKGNLIGNTIFKTKDGTKSEVVPAIKESSRQLDFPALLSYDDLYIYETITLLNPNTTPASVDIIALDKDGYEIDLNTLPSLSSMESRDITLVDIFNGSTLKNLSTVRVISDSDIVGLQLVDYPGVDLVGLPALTTTSKAWRFPIVTKGENLELWTKVGILNPGNDTAYFTVEAFDSNSNSLGTIHSQSLSSGATYSLSTLNANIVARVIPLNTAFLKVTSDQPISSYEIIGVLEGNGLTAALGIPGEDQTTVGFEITGSNEGDMLNAYLMVWIGDRSARSTVRSLESGKWREKIEFRIADNRINSVSKGNKAISIPFAATYSISGYVKSSDGTGVDGITVCAFSDGSCQKTSTQTDNSGYYIINGLAGNTTYFVKIVEDDRNKQYFFKSLNYPHRSDVSPNIVSVVKVKSSSDVNNVNFEKLDIDEASSGFSRPMPNFDSSNYGYTFGQRALYSSWVYHPGQDYNSPTNNGHCKNGTNGTLIYAVADGIVVDVRSKTDNDNCNLKAWGGAVIKHWYRGKAYYSQYGHMSIDTKNPLVIGQKVTKGTTIVGYEDNIMTGKRATHLHFEIRNDSHPKPYNKNYFTSIGNKDNVCKWYEHPDAFIESSGAYTDDPKIVVDERELLYSGENPLPSRWFSVNDETKFTHVPEDDTIPGVGFAGHMQYTRTATSDTPTAWGKWSFFISQEGNYEILAYIPGSNGTSQKAIYKIDGNPINPPIDQLNISKPTKWVTLGDSTLHFSVGNHYLQLDNNTGESGKQLAYDAIKIIYKGTSTTCTATVSSDRWKGEYYNNKDLSGSPAMVRDDGDGDINFDWGSDSPSSSCGIGADNFSVRWTRTISFDENTYRFTVNSDDGFRLYVDDELKLDKWIDQPPTTYTVDVPLSAGNHTIKMEYYENGGGAVAKLSWQAVSCTYSINPTTQSFSSSGGSGKVSVTASDSSCSWTAVSNDTSWITITSGSSGSGNGTVYYSVAANSSASSRTGTMTIAEKTFTMTQSGTSCTYSISPTSKSFDSNSGSGSVTVTTQSGCNWTATSNASWITITSGSSGSGNGTVNYSVAANSSTSSRTGTMTIAGKTLTVTQSGVGCTYSISPTSKSFDSNGGSESITVTTQSGCSWTATSNASWITITSGSSGSGNGTVNYSVAANSSTSLRTGTMTIAGNSFTVTQSGVSCTYSISSTSKSFDSNGGSESITVTTQSGCSWTATSNASWITITSGSSGSGSGTVNYSVASNSSTSSRTGTMAIAGKTFTITQSGASCTYTISPTSRSHGSGTETGSVSVTSGSGCSWTAVSNTSWITITSGSSGTGSGTVNYSVSANTGTSSSSSSRTGTITITGGNTFTVTQSGTGGGAPPDLTSSATVASSYTSGQTGVQIPVTVYRSGGNLTSGTYVHAKLYWSTNSTWDTGDSIKWSSNDSTPDFPNSVLNSNGTKTVTATVDIPSVSAGTYYIISYADAPTSSYPSGYYSESNEDNNTSPHKVSISDNPPPTAGFTMSAQEKTAYENETLNLAVASGQTVSVSFSASRSSDSDGSIASYKWYISSTSVSTSRDFNYSLGEGTHQIYLEVWDNLGSQSAVGASIIITSNPPPTAAFTMTAQGKTAYENETLNLTVASGQTVSVSFSAARSSDSDGSIASYKWYISSTSVSTSRDFNYSLGEGTHQIYLEVWDNLGSQSAVGATIIITATTVSYQGHFANTDWGSWVSNGATCGTPGGNQMEAIRITTSNYGIQYRAHVADYSWLSWVSNGAEAGTTGESKSLQAIEIKLTNAPSNLHVSYRVYVHGQGWQGWVSDGSTAGTTGQGLAVEAIEIKLENW